MESECHVWNYVFSLLFVRTVFFQMSAFSLLIEENENWKVLRSLRTLRALRPLRAIARWQGMKVMIMFWLLEIIFYTSDSVFKN